MNNDVVGLQKQVEIISNKLDTALHTLADYQRVVAGAVKGGVYENDNHWWRELCRLANEQAVEHTLAVGRACTCIRLESWRENENFCSLCGGHKPPAAKA